MRGDHFVGAEPIFEGGVIVEAPARKAAVLRGGVVEGTQYRSAAYYSNDDEKQIIESKINTLNESGKFTSKIVTEIEAISDFYNAEDYHQDYYKKRGIDGCAI